MFFYPILFEDTAIITFGELVFNIPANSYFLWKNIKYIFVIFTFLSNLIICNILVSAIFNLIHPKKNKKITTIKNGDFSILLGQSYETGENITIPEKGLYQNILVTGAIGSGKTSSAMYPITKQLINYQAHSSEKKLGMLILDVKGNYYYQVKQFAKQAGRLNDIIPIQISGKYKYNPLDKPNLKPTVLANRLKTILLLFSPNNSESYWIDKAETALAEAIKLCRLYNNNYVTFSEIHNLITDTNYYTSKIHYLREQFLLNKFNKKQTYDLLSAIKFFEKEFNTLDSRTLNILRSEITRITNCFVSDCDITRTFCPAKKEINFYGFEDVINSGKIVVLKMNINEYKNLSKIIATYLKLDFQTDVLRRLSKPHNEIRPVAFVSDEYSEYVSATDANFFSQSRESKCINVVATQSYTSLLDALNNKYSVEVIVQNLVNKLWFRSDDVFTIEDAQKQLGKADKEKSSRTISENAKETSYNLFTRSLESKNSNISESINTYLQYDYIYDTNFFTQQLDTFDCLSFISNGNKILKPAKLKMLPYFK